MCRFEPGQVWPGSYIIIHTVLRVVYRLFDMLCVMFMHEPPEPSPISWNFNLVVDGSNWNSISITHYIGHSSCCIASRLLSDKEKKIHLFILNFLQLIKIKESLSKYSHINTVSVLCMGIRKCLVLYCIDTSNSGLSAICGRSLPIPQRKATIHGRAYERLLVAPYKRM